MNKNNIIFILPLLLVLFILSSCSENIKFDNKIINDKMDNIAVQLTDVSFEDPILDNEFNIIDPTVTFKLNSKSTSNIYPVGFNVTYSIFDVENNLIKELNLNIKEDGENTISAELNSAPGYIKLTDMSDKLGQLNDKQKY